MKPLIYILGLGCLIIGQVIDSNFLTTIGIIFLVGLLCYEYGRNSGR